MRKDIRKKDSMDCLVLRRQKRRIFVDYRNLHEGIVIGNAGKSTAWTALYCDVQVLLREWKHGTGRLSAALSYMTLTAKKDTMLAAKGQAFKVHEFHYWNSSNIGADYEIAKASDGSVAAGGYGTDTLYAGFPHIYFYGRRTAADRFIKTCRSHHAAGSEMQNAQGQCTAMKMQQKVCTGENNILKEKNIEKNLKENFSAFS